MGMQITRHHVFMILPSPYLWYEEGYYQGKNIKDLQFIGIHWMWWCWEIEL